MAPLMARSLTVPFTARSPMLPPGKNSGRTTNESVEKAIRPSADIEHRRVAEAGERRVAVARQEHVVDQLGRHRAAAAVAHHDGRAVAQRQRAGPALEAGQVRRRRAELDLLNQRSSPPACRCRASGQHRQPPVEVVRRTRALARDHRGAERVARRAQRPEGLALVRLDQALEHLAAAADRRLLGVDVADGEAVLGVVPRGTSPRAASRSAGSSRCRARRGR